MAIAGVIVALAVRHLDRRRGIWMSLALLAVPTSLPATAPELTVFMALRVAQGLCMSTVFTLTMAYFVEQSSAEDTAGALAAYITGLVASNLLLLERYVGGGNPQPSGLRANF